MTDLCFFLFAHFFISEIWTSTDNHSSTSTKSVNSLENSALTSCGALQTHTPLSLPIPESPLSNLKSQKKFLNGWRTSLRSKSSGRYATTIGTTTNPDELAVTDLSSPRRFSESSPLNTPQKLVGQKSRLVGWNVFKFTNQSILGNPYGELQITTNLNINILLFTF
jgi:hypothetical protein